MPLSIVCGRKSPCRSKEQSQAIPYCRFLLRLSTSSRSSGLSIAESKLLLFSKASLPKIPIRYRPFAPRSRRSRRDSFVPVRSHADPSSSHLGLDNHVFRAQFLCGLISLLWSLCDEASGRLDAVFLQEAHGVVFVDGKVAALHRVAGKGRGLKGGIM